MVGWPVLSLSIIHVRWDVLRKLMPDTVVCALIRKLKSLILSLIKELNLKFGSAQESVGARASCKPTALWRTKSVA